MQSHTETIVHENLEVTKEDAYFLDSLRRQFAVVAFPDRFKFVERKFFEGLNHSSTMVYDIESGPRVLIYTEQRMGEAFPRYYGWNVVKMTQTETKIVSSYFI